MQRRFLQLSDVAEILNISASQTYALVRQGKLAAIKIGGRGAWRVEDTALEAYIARCYRETQELLDKEALAEVLDEEPAAEEVGPEDKAD